MREKLTTGDVPFRKAYLGSLIDRVEVDDREARIVGRKEVLEQAVLASRQGQAGVHSFVPKRRTAAGSRVPTVNALAVDSGEKFERNLSGKFSSM